MESSWGGVLGRRQGEVEGPITLCLVESQTSGTPTRQSALMEEALTAPATGPRCVE